LCAETVNGENSYDITIVCVFTFTCLCCSQSITLQMNGLGLKLITFISHIASEDKFL